MRGYERRAERREGGRKEGNAAHRSIHIICES